MSVKTNKSPVKGTFSLELFLYSAEVQTVLEEISLLTVPPRLCLSLVMTWALSSLIFPKKYFI